MTSRSEPPASPRRFGRGAALLVTVGALWSPRQAFAQAPESLELRWRAPSECPSEQQVRARIRQLAGSALAQEAPVRADATIVRGRDDRLHLELVVHVGDLVGTRRIEGTSCEDLAGAAAVALALLLRSPTPLSEEDLGASGAGGPSPDGSSAAEPGSAGERRGTEGGESASNAAPEPARPPLQSPTDRRPRRWHGLLQAPLATVGVGPLPEPSFGLAAAAGASFARWRFLAEGTGWLGQRMTVRDDPSIRADVHLVAAGLLTCWEAVRGRFGLAPCVVMTVEHLWARGTGPHVTPRTADATWIAPGLGGQAFWHPVPWFGLVGQVTAQIEASRPRIAIDGVGTLGRTQPASMALAIGLEWIL